jgi:hypothetical protein
MNEKTSGYRRSWLAVWLIAVALAGSACFYNASRFAPQQLDGPNTLRPLVAGCFSAFIALLGSPYRAAFAWYALCLLLLTVPAAGAFLNYWRLKAAVPKRFSRISHIVCSKWFFLGSILSSMAVIRAPWLLMGELNVDESQFIVSADKLFRDPVFFRAVDCGTVGPVDVLPLMLPGIFGMTPDYASSRVIALAMLFVSVWILYRAFGLVAEDWLARLAAVPIAGILAVLGTRDLTHYASEVPTLLLVAVAIYAALRIISKPGSPPAWFGVLGLLVCLAFFAKMQSVPILAAVGAVTFLYVLSSARLSGFWRPLGWFLAGAAAPFALNAAVCGLTGVWTDFWINYAKGNLAYAGQTGGLGLWSNGLWSNLDEFVLQVAEARYALFTFTSLIAAYLYQKTPLWRLRTGFVARATGLIFVTGIALFALTILREPVYIILGFFALFAVVELRGLRGANAIAVSRIWLGLLALVLIGAGAGSIYAAHRTFPHYVLLLLIPAGLGIASLLLRQPELMEPSSPAKHYGLAFLLIFLVVNLGMQARALPTATEYAAVFKFARRTIRPMRGDYIRSLTPLGGSVVVWGWDASLYLAAGVLPATRDTNMRNFFSPEDNISAYHRRRFLTDMSRNHPEVFIDAAIAGNPFLDENYRFETVPEVAEYINRLYVLVGTDFGGMRYYRANGLPPVARQQDR